MTRCICSTPGTSIQCVACYPHLGEKVNDAQPTYVLPPGGSDV